MGIEKGGAGGWVHPHIEHNTHFSPIKEKGEALLICQGTSTTIFGLRLLQKHAQLLEGALIC